MKKSGFTLIELMVAMVVGLTAITSVYSLGSAMSKQFYEEQRTASAQGTSRVAIMELRQDISRAGLFGSPNGSLEPTCDSTPPSLPLLGGSSGPMGAFQYYADEDLAVLDPHSANTGVVADRLRVLTSLYLTDQLLVHSASNSGSTIVLQSGNQAYRRTFSWGQTAGPFTSGSAPTYLTGDLDWDSAWGGETASWNGIAQKGARAFQTGSVLHIETPEGRHFFRSVFGKDGNTEDEVRMQITPPLPVGTALSSRGGGRSHHRASAMGRVRRRRSLRRNQVGADFMDFERHVLHRPRSHESDVHLQDAGASTFEAPNRVLVRRVLDSTTGNVLPNSTQVVAEFVSNFRVSFLIDTTSGTTTSTSAPVRITTKPRSTATRSRSGRSSSSWGFAARSRIPRSTYSTITDAGTRFEVDDTQMGSARVRHMHIEVPVMNVARRNL